MFMNGTQSLRHIQILKIRVYKTNQQKKRTSETIISNRCIVSEWKGVGKAHQITNNINEE